MIDMQKYDYIKELDLPIGVYLTDNESNIILSNRRFREIVGISENDDSNHTMKEFYADKSICEKNKNDAENLASNGIYFEKDIYLIDGRWVRDYCKVILDSETCETIGFMGCLGDNTGEKSFREIFDRLNAIVYKLDENDNIIQINSAVKDVLGYEPEELIGKSVSTIYFDYKNGKSNDADLIMKSVKENPEEFKHKKQVSLKHKDGKELTFWANITPLFKLGCYNGREGALTDITREVRLEKLLNYIPVGAYIIKYYKDENGNKIEKIEDCNKFFAQKIFHFKNEEEAIGTDVSKVWYDFDQSQNFEKLIEKNPDDATAYIWVKTIDTEDVFLSEVHARAIVEKPTGKIIGRTGAIRNAKGEEELMDETSNVFHRFLATLSMLKNTFAPAFRLMGNDPFGGSLSIKLNDISEPILKSKKALELALDKFVELSSDSKHYKKALTSDNWLELKEMIEVIKNLEKEVPQEFWDTTLQVTSAKIIDICANIKPKTIPHNLKRDVNTKARKLAQLCCLIQFYRARERIFEIETQVSDLRTRLFSRYSFTPVINTQDLRVFKIKYLISRAIENIAMFALLSNVKITVTADSEDFGVKVEQFPIIIALFNVLHNAVKYSWHKKESKGNVWVTIKYYVKNNRGYVDVSNYGVPIQKDEIVRGKIFEIGSRGNESSDRGRSGMGLGLPTTKNILKKYGGNIVIKSRPARSSDKEGDYTVPFITSVTIDLPPK